MLWSSCSLYLQHSPRLLLHLLSKTTAFVLTLMFLAAMPAQAPAGYIDPATLQIGPQLGGTLSPVQIGNSGLITIFQNQNGNNATLTNPFLLILGVVNPSSGFGFSNSSITSVTTTAGGTTSWELGGAVPSYITNTTQPDETKVTWNATTGFGGDVTSSSGNAYSVLGFTGTDSSNNWTNWSGADQSINGITATEFALYVFQITATMGAKDTVSVQFAKGALPVGTFAIAYGESSTYLFDTPFTEAGLTTSQNFAVPAPPSVVLLGGGGFCLAGFLAMARRRRVAVA